MSSPITRRNGLLNFLREGALEIIAAARSYYIAAVFGWQDIAQRYRRSKVGAFWITISVGVMIGTLSVVFGSLFRLSLEDFLPFVAIGIILWTFITSTINEGCMAFIEAAGMILQVRLPLFTHIARVIWRNVIILGHNLLILPLVFVGFRVTLDTTALLAIPGFALLLLNLIWMSLVLAIFSTRFRDITQAVQNFMQVAFFVTPIMWMPHTMSERMPETFLVLNPFYHLLELVRAPMLGHAPSTLTWSVGLGMATFGWLFALTFFGRFGRRIPYWL